MKLFFSVLFTAISVVALSACASKALPLQLESTGKNSSFAAYGVQLSPTLTPYHDYIANAKRVITSGRAVAAEKALKAGTMTPAEAAEYQSKELIDAVAPFHLAVNSQQCPQGPVGAIVLVHATFVTPAAYRGLAEDFNQHCYDVRSVLLPGHGTAPGDLREVRAKDFKQAVHYAVLTAHVASSNVTVVGESLGGALGLLEAMQHGDVSRVIAFAPAIAIQKGSLIPLAVFMNREYASTQGSENPLRNKKELSYSFQSINGAAAVRDIAKEVRKGLKAGKLNVPVLVISSNVDKVVKFKQTKSYFDKTFPSRSELIIFSNESPATTEVVNGRTTIIMPIKTEAEGKRVISYTHFNLSRKPTDAVYGAASSERMGCEGYLGQDELLKQCRAGKFDFLGETNDENMKKYPGNLERLLYNPSYDEMMQKVFQFLGAPVSP